MSEVDELVSLTVSGRERRVLERAAWCVANWPWESGEARGLTAGARGRARRLWLELERSGERLDRWTGLVPDEVIAARLKVRSVLVLPRRDWQVLARGLAATVIDLGAHERAWQRAMFHSAPRPTMRDVRALRGRLAALVPSGDVRRPEPHRFAPIFGGPTVSLALSGAELDLLLSVLSYVNHIRLRRDAQSPMAMQGARGRLTVADDRLRFEQERAFRALGLHRACWAHRGSDGWMAVRALRARVRVPLRLLLADLEALAWAVRGPVARQFAGDWGWYELRAIAWSEELERGDLARLGDIFDTALAAARARWPQYQAWPR